MPDPTATGWTVDAEAIGHDVLVWSGDPDVFTHELTVEHLPFGPGRDAAWLALVQAVRDADTLREIDQLQLSDMTKRQLRRRVKEIRRAKRQADEHTMRVVEQRDTAMAVIRRLSDKWVAHPDIGQWWTAWPQPRQEPITDAEQALLDLVWTEDGETAR